MPPIPVAAIFDVGKTNKKLFLIDRDYKIVFERSAKFNETVDEDGDACENIESLRLSIYDSLREVLSKKDFNIKSVNFATYGASFVYLDKDDKPLTPLYNYLKPYPDAIKKTFYDTYGGEEAFARKTASPVLGSLNSGMQLYRIKMERPAVFKKIKYALHLPQYLSYLVTGKAYADITSIGCHTNLWDFDSGSYHNWVMKEGLSEKLAPLVTCDTVTRSTFKQKTFNAGAGLHDSSAALIPYIMNFREPFVLISTGTWCITLNPFNHNPLTADELKKDCLCYLSNLGQPVKASRLFAGYEHEQQVKRIAEFFHQHPAHFRSLSFDPALIRSLEKRYPQTVRDNYPLNDQLVSDFSKVELSEFSSGNEAYHFLMLDIVRRQYISTQLVLKKTGVKRIFVDGGFSNNSVYMHLLASLFPDTEVFAASIAQATAVGTAIALHDSWNDRPLSNDIVELKYYPIRER